MDWQVAFLIGILAFGLLGLVFLIALTVMAYIRAGSKDGNRDNR